jgi:hypothetical protein
MRLAIFKLTGNEEKLLKSMNHNFTVKQAANATGLSLSQAYNILYRLRNKRKLAQSYINIINNYCKSSRLTNKVLAYKVSVRDDALLEEEE